MAKNRLEILQETKKLYQKFAKCYGVFYIEFSNCKNGLPTSILAQNDYENMQLVEQFIDAANECGHIADKYVGLIDSYISAYEKQGLYDEAIYMSLFIYTKILAEGLYKFNMAAYQDIVIGADLVQEFYSEVEK